MPLTKQEGRTIGLRVRRIEGEDEQAVDIGRIGTIMPPNTYNLAGGTMTVTYDPTESLPIKTDNCCTFFEFEKVAIGVEVHA